MSISSISSGMMAASLFKSPSSSNISQSNGSSPAPEGSPGEEAGESPSVEAAEKSEHGRVNMLV